MKCVPVGGNPSDREAIVVSIAWTNGSGGGLNLVELEAAIDGLLDVGGALDRVAVGVEAQRAGNGIDGQTGQRVADGGAVGGLGFSMAATAAIYAS